MQATRNAKLKKLWKIKQSGGCFKVKTNFQILKNGTHGARHDYCYYVQFLGGKYHALYLGPCDPIGRPLPPLPKLEQAIAQTKLQQPELIPAGGRPTGRAAKAAAQSAPTAKIKHDKK